MSDQSYTTTISVDRTPAEVFEAINDVRAWWNRNLEGDTHRVGDEFTHHVEGIHTARIRVTELVPGERVVWRVLDNWMGFISDQREWKDTEIRFEISQADGATEVRFTHVGLVPDYECFDVCRDAWGMYIGGSLRSFITTGQGTPNSTPAEVDDDEARALLQRTA